MLYLLHPCEPVQLCSWATTDGPVHDTERLVELPWQPTAEELDPTLVHLAVRHGTSCQTGIVIHHAFVVMRNSVVRWSASGGPDQLAPSAPPASLGQEYAAAVRDFDERMERSERRMLDIARRRLDLALAPPPVAALVRHWIELGGADVGRSDPRDEWG